MRRAPSRLQRREGSHGDPDPSSPQGLGEAVPVGVPTLGLLLATRCPKAPHPGGRPLVSRSCKPRGTGSPPPSWDLALGAQREARTLVAAQSSCPLPVSLPTPPHPHFSDPEHTGQGSTPQEAQKGFPAAGGRRMFWKTVWSWMDPARKCRSVWPLAPMTVTVVAAGGAARGSARC